MNVNPLDFPALEGRVVTEAHAKVCRTQGHARHVVDKIDTTTCPRCGEFVDHQEAIAVLRMAETLRKIQHETNRWDDLAYESSAWGHLRKAIVKVLTKHLELKGYADAEKVAERLLHEVYDNGENIAYQIRLLKDGVITL